jgi:hypothetical protein
VNSVNPVDFMASWNLFSHTKLLTYIAIIMMSHIFYTCFAQMKFHCARIDFLPLLLTHVIVYKIQWPVTCNSTSPYLYISYIVFRSTIELRYARVLFEVTANMRKSDSPHTTLPPKCKSQDFYRLYEAELYLKQGNA